MHVQLAGAAQADDGLTLIQFMPAGEFGPSDGRTMDVPAWRIDADSARSVIVQHAARRNPVVIDYEHRTLLKEHNGQPARELRWVDGEGLFGAVALTANARRAIDADEYLYFPPCSSTPARAEPCYRCKWCVHEHPQHPWDAAVSLLAAATTIFLPTRSTPRRPQ